MTLTAIESAAIEQASAAPMLARTEAWVAINSGTRNLAGLGKMADSLARAFSVLPGELALVDPAPAETVTSDGNVQPIEHGRHLHLTVRPEAPVQMLLTGHMDTVYAADHPFQTLTWLEDGRAWNGPGAADMKGGMSLMLAALRAVEAIARSPRIGYEVLINSDEETGSGSSAALIARAARGKVAALTYEPALPDGTLAGARGGSGNFSIVVHGKSAHAGRNPEEGRNAIVAAADLGDAAERCQSARPAVNPARIDGGGPNNVVPDLAILRVNFRPGSPPRSQMRAARSRSTPRSPWSHASMTCRSTAMAASTARPSRSIPAPSGCSPGQAGRRRSRHPDRPGRPPAACATATISRPAACRWSIRWGCAAARFIRPTSS
jgi:glutamate carboxypeptidase